jgi:DNA-binding transcriptional regulator YhcF (GntR family)
MATKKSNDFLSQLVGDASKARVVRALVLGENEVFSPELMSKRAGVSPRTARAALAQLEKMGLSRKSRIASLPAEPAKKQKRQKKLPLRDVWYLNADFLHLRALSMFVREVSPLDYDEVLDALKKTGRLSVVVLSGSFVGDATRPADIVIAGESINERRMETAVRALENLFGRELRYATFPTAEFRYRLTVQDKLLRDTFDFPHRVLLDRIRL